MVRTGTMQDHVRFIVACLLFGSNGLIAAQMALPSVEIVLVRSGIGGLGLVVMCLVAHRGIRSLGGRRNLAMSVAAGASLGVSWIFLYEAYREVGVAISSVTYYCAPIMVMALSPLLFKERIVPRALIGFAVVLCGSVALNIETVDTGGSAWGMFCAWMSSVGHAAMIVFSKKSDHADGVINSTVQIIVSFVLVGAFAVVAGSHVVVPSSSDWGWGVILGLVNTSLCLYLYLSAYRGLPVQSVATLSYLEPLSAVVLAALILGEAMSVVQIVGTVLILGGVIYSEWVGFHAKTAAAQRQSPLGSLSKREQ